MFSFPNIFPRCDVKSRTLSLGNVKAAELTEICAAFIVIESGGGTCSVESGILNGRDVIIESLEAKRKVVANLYHKEAADLTPKEYRLMAENPEISKSAWN